MGTGLIFVYLKMHVSPLIQEACSSITAQIQVSLPQDVKAGQIKDLIMPHSVVCELVPSELSCVR